MKVNMFFNRIFLKILFLLLFQIASSQTSDDLKKFMETYDKLKVDQEANEVVKKGIDSEKSIDDGPIKLLVTPADISRYYSEKLNNIKNDILRLNEVLPFTDSIPPLKDFGYNYFSRRDSITFIDNISIDDSYVLGFGDEISFSVWGQVEQYEKLTIQRNGTIYLPSVGLLNLGGKNLFDAKSYVFDRFSKVYSTLKSKPQLSFLDISVENVKKINVTLSGHVTYPGNYVINPSITLTNLLVMAGGVTKTGTLRNIYLNRNAVTIDTIDLYPLISGNGSSNRLSLVNNDVIRVPSKGKTISINGAVRIPGYYELKNNNVQSILSFAGDINKNAQDRLFLYRNSGNNSIINQIDYSSSFLMEGDSIVVPYKNVKPKFISLSIGSREFFNIPWIKSLSYDQIFTIADINKENIKRIELVRKVGNDKFETYLLQNYDGGSFDFLPYDHISIGLFNSFAEIDMVTIVGSVNSPGKYALTNHRESLQSIIDRSGGLQSSIDLNNVYIKRDSLKIGPNNGNFILSPGDTVVAGSYNGIVKIEGEVHNPGPIQWIENRSIKDYIDLAGGFTAYSDRKHIFYVEPNGEAFKVKIFNQSDVKPGGRITVRQKPENELNNKPDTFQQFSSVLTSLVTLAILANSTRN